MRALFTALLLMVPMMLWGQILRPPILPCSETELFYCDLFNLSPCPCGGMADITRMSPIGPTVDPWLGAGNYKLPRTIAPVQLAYELYPISPRATSHMTSYELLDEIMPQGFGGIKIWMDAIPFEGMGEWCWQTYYGFEHCADYSLPGVEMERFWLSIPEGSVIVLRPQAMNWTWWDDGPAMALADYYAISKKLYELIGERDVTIILTDWEQDWIIDRGYQDFLMRILEQRQEDVERARKEAFLERGYRPNLRIMHAAIVNKTPINAPDWPHPYLADLIPGLKRSPDLVGISYWMQGSDPVEVLEWVREATGYPKHRMYIDEFGGKEDRQAQRFSEYIPVFWEYGIDLVCIWMYKQTWCDEKSQLGIWRQAQPCAGKVVFTEPTDGYWILMDLLREVGNVK